VVADRTLELPNRSGSFGRSVARLIDSKGTFRVSQPVPLSVDDLFQTKAGTKVRGRLLASQEAIDANYAIGTSDDIFKLIFMACVEAENLKQTTTPCWWGDVPHRVSARLRTSTRRRSTTARC